jgi:KUP system potassium uptake protein
MCLWFLTLAVLGVNMVDRPGMLLALDPRYAVHFFIVDPVEGVPRPRLGLPGGDRGEALYADMGHFGKRPIRLAWFAIVLPALMLNYLGQGALLLQHPDASPTRSTAGARLGRAADGGAGDDGGGDRLAGGDLGRVLGGAPGDPTGLPAPDAIVHTSAREIGQVYVPFTNWTLLAFMGAGPGFRSSNNLAAAYGIAVTGTMMIDTCSSPGAGIPGWPRPCLWRYY